MIDHRFQGKGVGRSAMEAALAEIRSIPELERITICYHPEKPLAQPFYASFGFKEIGIDEDGEMIAVIGIT